MRKVISIMAVTALLFSMNVNAQEKAKAKKTAKTEKTAAAATPEKKACADGAKKGGCCAHK